MLWVLFGILLAIRLYSSFQPENYSPNYFRFYSYSFCVLKCAWRLWLSRNEMQSRLINVATWPNNKLYYFSECLKTEGFILSKKSIRSNRHNCRIPDSFIYSFQLINFYHLRQCLTTINLSPVVWARFGFLVSSAKYFRLFNLNWK